MQQNDIDYGVFRSPSYAYYNSVYSVFAYTKLLYGFSVCDIGRFLHIYEDYDYARSLIMYYITGTYAWKIMYYSSQYDNIFQYITIH